MRETDIKVRVGRLIQKQREALQKEIELYTQKRDDTEEVYGFGGAYTRQQAAIEKREKQLQELDDFEAQLKHAEKHQEVAMYIFGCRSCGSITMVSGQPFSDWHECPVCRSMVNLPSLKAKTFRIADTGEGWMEQLKELAKEGGNADTDAVQAGGDG